MTSGRIAEVVCDGRRPGQADGQAGRQAGRKREEEGGVNNILREGGGRGRSIRGAPLPSELHGTLATAPQCAPPEQTRPGLTRPAVRRPRATCNRFLHIGCREREGRVADGNGAAATGTGAVTGPAGVGGCGDHQAVSRDAVASGGSSQVLPVTGMRAGSVSSGLVPCPVFPRNVAADWPYTAMWSCLAEDMQPCAL
jgi:hypothetical protein